MAWNPILPTTATKLRSFPAIQTQNNIALQDALSASTLNGLLPYIPFTTSSQPAPIYFYLNAAPSGWDLVGTVADCLLAIQGGTSQYASPAGGTVVGTWLGPGYSLNVADIPTGTSTGIVPAIATNNFAAIIPNAHHHDYTTTRPMAAVGILCTKTA